MTHADEHPTPTRSPRRRPPTHALAAGTILAVTLAIGAGCAPAADADALAARQAEVADAGAQVMPFDLDRTSHVFTDLPDGGRQTVTADIPTDTDQIGLIRQHLQHEADRFRRADFGDPAAIHGDDMPGLAELRTSAGRIDVIYEQLDNGGQLTYRSAEPALVTAIHTWFAAQTADHGNR